MSDLLDEELASSAAIEVYRKIREKDLTVDGEISEKNKALIDKECEIIKNREIIATDPVHEPVEIINKKGRVTENDGAVVNQLYTAGWIKRGPSGIIGTNRACSSETIQCLLSDLEKLNTGTKKYGASEIYSKLDNKNIRHVNFDEWSQIDTKEIEIGEPKGKPREKYTYIEEMLSVIK